MTEQLDIVWGAKRIAAFLGCGVDFVYSLGRDPHAPVRKLRGTIYASRSELASYLLSSETGQNPKSPKHS